MLLTSCVRPHDLAATMDIDTTRLREIETVDFAAASLQAPVSIEEAAERLSEEAVLEHLLEHADAPNELSLSLDDVREAALRFNLDLEVARLNPRISETAVTAEEAKFEATLSGSIRRNKADGPTALGTQGSQSTFDSYDVGVSVPMRTGGTLDVRMPLTRSQTNNPFALLNPSYDLDLQVALTQPLLRGAGLAVNTASISIERHRLRQQEALTKLETIRMLAAADRAYWRLYAARGELDVRRRQYEVAIEQLERARRRVRAGDVAEIEITRAGSAAAAQLEQIIIAETEVRIAERDLLRIMNRPDLEMGAPTALLLVTPPLPLGLDLDSDRLAAHAIANRMEMVELELAMAIDALNIDLSRDAALPLLTADVTYNINGLGGTAGAALDQLDDRRFEDWVLGLRAEYPIGNEAAEARLQGAIITRLQRIATRELRAQTIRQEVHDNLDLMEQAWQRILAAERASELASLTYDAEVRQFNAGERTSTDVNDALAQLADAESRKVRAITDYQVAQVNLAVATGTVLGHGRVRWGDSP